MAEIHGGKPNSARPLTTEELRASKPTRKALLNEPRTPMVFVLDGVSNASNVGNIFRVADSMKAEHVFLCASRVSLTGSKFRRASKGIEKWVPHTLTEDTLQVVRDLKTRGVTVLGVELTPGSVPLTKIKILPPIAIVVGGETEGIQPAVLALCDVVVALPMLGMGNSINVSNALGAVAYYLALDFMP